MRCVRGAIVVVLVFAIGAFMQLPTSALEGDDGTLAPPTPYINGPNGPLIFVIGDSISADAQQKDIYAYINGSLGWKTQIEAVGGANITHHQRFGSFTHARDSQAKAVFVELGTNDIGLINDDMTLPEALTEIAKVFQAVDGAVAALGTERCIVWVGLNEQWDAHFGPNGPVYNDIDVAAAFNDYLNSLLPSHPNLHYADYDAYVQANATYRDSLLADIVQIHPTNFDGKVQLGNFEAWYGELYC